MSPITPKSPSILLKEFNKNFVAYYTRSDTNIPEAKLDSDVWQDEVNRWLNEAFVSLIAWSVEQVKMDEKQRQGEDLLFSSVEDGADDILTQARMAHSKGYHRGQEASRELLAESLRQKDV